MSLRLKIAVAASLAFHLALVIFLVKFPMTMLRQAVDLSASGGVIWFNLDPGGSGSGGGGGLGAPKQAEASKEAASGEAAKLPRPPEQKKIDRPPVKKSDAVSVDRKTAEREKLRAFTQESPPRETAVAALPQHPPASPRPGEGDEAGQKTGPAPGQGKGLGDGKGSGTGSGEGPGGVGPPGTGGGETGGAGSSALNQIRRKILRAKRYPRLARQAGMEGVSGLMFQIASDGSLQQVQIVTSSGFSELDAEALATVRRAAPFPYYPAPIRFTLKFSLKDDR